MRSPLRSLAWLPAAALLASAAAAHAAPIDLSRLVDPSRARAFDGGSAAPVASASAWRQLAFELRGPAGPAALPDLGTLEARARAVRAGGALPLALVDLGVTGAGATDSRVFAAAVLAPPARRGGDATLVLDPDLLLSDDPSPARLELDPGDGGGWRVLEPGAPVRARWSGTGTQIVAIRRLGEDGTVRVARATFEVAALATPAPDDTLHITATVPFRGVLASGNAYVYLAPGHAGMVNPVVVPEGFDLDNTMGADELYALLDQQGLADTLRSLGYDAVVLDFADATDWIERNAMVLEALLEQVQATIPPSATIAMVGPSMGGLVGRYALAWMETHGVPHRVRTFISFDTPHEGADIPLGIQYWVEFFAGQSASAAALLARLQTPAACEMLVYHLTRPAGSTGTPDSLRAVLAADLAAVGDWPAQPRRVAIANGSGAGAGQGFAPGAQVIQYDYNILLVHVRGNVWAVPDGVSTRIFDGLIQIPFQTTQSLQVTVSGTLPYDSAPGGWRATMTQMDTTTAPVGDIVALYPHHAFIPTVSALDVSNSTLYENLLADPTLVTRTPFDAVYAPLENQEHVTVTPENKLWLLDEIQRVTLAVGPDAGARALELAPAAPNPLAGGATLRFRLPAPVRARLTVHDLDGRAVATLADGMLEAGPHSARWEARDAAGRRVAPGIYFARLTAGREARVTRLVVVR